MNVEQNYLISLTQTGEVSDAVLFGQPYSYLPEQVGHGTGYDQLRCIISQQAKYRLLCGLSNLNELSLLYNDSYQWISLSAWNTCV